MATKGTAKRGLTKQFLEHSYKPKEYYGVDTKGLTDAQLKKEYTRVAKVANKRIDAIKKAGAYSTIYSVYQREYRSVGIKFDRFGIKNLNIQDRDDMIREYNRVIRFLNRETSTKTGIKEQSKNLAKALEKYVDDMEGILEKIESGRYVEFQRDFEDIWRLLDDLEELEQQGVIQGVKQYYRMVIDELAEARMEDVNLKGGLTEEIITRVSERLKTEYGITEELYRPRTTDWRID